MQKAGEAERAAQLLDASEQFLHANPGLGANDRLAFVEIHLLRGEKQQALSALRAAARAGWRGRSWRAAKGLPIWAPIRDAPELKVVFAEIEEDMVRQRAMLAARPKDAPLVPPVVP